MALLQCGGGREVVSDLDFDVSEFFSIMRLEQSDASDLVPFYRGPTRQHKQIGEIIPVVR
jgi:hypothetical protein